MPPIVAPAPAWPAYPQGDGRRARGADVARPAALAPARRLAVARLPHPDGVRGGAPQPAADLGRWRPRPHRRLPALWLLQSRGGRLPRAARRPGAAPAAGDARP